MMKYLGLFILLFSSSIITVAANQDSIRIEQWLDKAAYLPRDSCRTLHFARLMMGIPYASGTLDVGECEELVVHTDCADCTTFVETVLALTIADASGCRTYDGFKSALSSLRYRNGVMGGYASRLHYFGDWIADNSRRGHIAECTSQTIFACTMVLNLDFMSTHPDSYAPLRRDPSLVALIAHTETAWKDVQVPYIPKESLHLPSSSLSIRNGDILAITTGIKGLDVVHVGFAFWRYNRLYLLHASSSAGKVVEESRPLFEYSQVKKSHTGVRVIRWLNKYTR